MIRPIYLYGSEVLRQKAVPADIDNDKEGIQTLVADLWETLKVSEGCGLAAPQVGESVRVAVVDGDVMADVFPYLKGFKRTFINPTVKSFSEAMCEYEEGCLSVPGIYASVRRPESIVVEYYDESFTLKTESFDKFACRMIEHEFSHLDGELFTDIVAPIRRKMIGKKLQNIAQGKIRTSYKSKIK
ncbi:MAG TPA: peptide deformylase [Rikenellaceae bacterium]|nr:peptide deformylase [Rikenellaceae bacterium]